VDRATKFIEWIQLIHQGVQEQLEKSQAKYKARHDMHRVDHQFKEGDQVWLYINKERMQGEGKKLKPIRYGPFKILDKIGTNAFWLELPPYMQIYSVVNVENLRLYEPPMIEDQGENVQEYLRVGLKGTNPSHAKWMETGKVRAQYPHLFTN
jgi:hypothetical protein